MYFYRRHRGKTCFRSFQRQFFGQRQWVKVKVKTFALVSLPALLQKQTLPLPPRCIQRKPLCYHVDPPNASMLYPPYLYHNINPPSSTRYPSCEQTHRNRDCDCDSNLSLARWSLPSSCANRLLPSKHPTLFCNALYFSTAKRISVIHRVSTVRASSIRFTEEPV